MGAQRLGEALEGVLKRLHLERRVRERLAARAWAEVVGEGIARNAWAVGVREGVLLVGATTSIWAQELALLKPQLMERLNALAGKPVIEDIRFKVMQRRPGVAVRGGSRRGGTPPPQDLPIPATKRALLEEMTAGVAEEARTRLRSALLALERVGAWKRQMGWKRCPACGRPHPRPGSLCPACGWARR